MVLLISQEVLGQFSAGPSEGAGRHFFFYYSLLYCLFPIELCHALPLFHFPVESNALTSQSYGQSLFGFLCHSYVCFPCCIRSVFLSLLLFLKFAY